MSHLGSMAIQRVAVPVPLHQPEDEELPADIDTVCYTQLFNFTIKYIFACITPVTPQQPGYKL